MKKRGISSIVSTLLIILFTLSSVVLIWVGISPTIQDSVSDSSTSFENVEGGLKIITSKGYTVYDPGSGKLSVQVRRGSGDLEITRIDFIFVIDGDSVVISSTNVLNPNEIKTYSFNDPLLTEFSGTDSIKIAVIYGDDDGIVTSKVTGIKKGIVNVENIDITDITLSHLYSDLVFYLPFDTNPVGGISYDSTENNNDLNIYNGTEYVTTGKIGGALNFDGADDIGIIINTPELESMVTDFSIALWVKPDFDSSTDKSGVPIDKFDSNGGWKLLFRQNTDVFSFRFRNSGVNQQCEVTNTMTFSAGTWIHVIGTWNGTYSSIYIDGVLNNTCLLTGPMSSSVNPINIGQSFNFRAFWNGSIDEVMLFDKSLTFSEVTEIYNSNYIG